MKNLERIFKYTLKETSADKMIDILHEKTKCLIDQHITQRDVENFVAYLKFLSGSTRGQKVIKLERKLVQDFVDRIYSECDHKTRYYRTKDLYSYFENKLGKNVALDYEELTVIYNKLREDREPSMEKIMKRVCVAIILKWLQGSLQATLSEELKKYVAFLATVYGLYGTDRVFNVEWPQYEISPSDLAAINSKYKDFETAVTDAIKRVRKAILKKPVSKKYKDQFEIILMSIDNLIKLSRSGRLDSVQAFVDKIIIAATLIYMQDEFVKRDPELQKFINLLVSFYYQFRDKRYIPVFTGGSLIRGSL
jgi:soluble cytochrome b562